VPVIILWAVNALLVMMPEKVEKEPAAEPSLC
jgi:hypothetical protein